jgi:hypothetical protein
MQSISSNHPGQDVIRTYIKYPQRNVFKAERVMACREVRERENRIFFDGCVDEHIIHISIRLRTADFR